MTEYLYSISLAQQTRLFLWSLGFGFLAGAFYDFFRSVRICLGSRKWAYKITDISYLLVMGFLNFLFFLSFNEGEIRLFVFFGELLGFIVYICTVGFTFIKYFEKFVNLIKSILTAIFKVLTYPFRKILEKFRKFLEKHRKKPEKNENKSKYPLKVSNNLLYNLSGRKSKKESQSEEENENAG